MSTRANYDRFLLLLHHAAQQADRWTDALTALAQCFSGIGGMFATWDKRWGNLQFLGVSQHLPVQAEILFRHHHGGCDPFRVLLDTVATGSWLACPKNFDKSSVEESALYWKYFLSHGIHHIAGAHVWDSPDISAYVFVHRAAAQGPFHQQDLKLLNALSEHMRTAAETHERLHRLSVTARIWNASSRSSQSGYIVTEATGRIVYASEVMWAVFAQSNDLLIKDGILATRRHFETTRLLNLIKSAATSDPQIDSPSFLLIGRSIGRKPYIVTISPFHSRGVLSARFGIPLAVIYFSDPEMVTNVDEQQLQSLFGLTPAEARITVWLIRGKQLREIAEAYEVRMPTLRTQLASILQKLELKRQSDIIRMAFCIRTLDSNALNEHSMKADL